MKISLNTLASVQKEDVVAFINMTGLDYQQIEKYVGGQINKLSLLREKAYRVQKFGKIEKKEFDEICAFSNENLQKCEEIVRNFDLFKNVRVVKNTYASMNRKLNYLLNKDNSDE